MYKLLFCSFGFILLCTFTACQKESAQKTNPPQLKKTAGKQGDSLHYTYYKYDDQNRLASVSTTDNRGLSEQFRTDLFYDTQGRMVRATENNNGTYTFQYDSQNRIIQKLRMIPSSSPYPPRSTYAYDAKGRLIADTTHSSWANEIFQYVAYTYDQNDNIIEAKLFRNSAGRFELEKLVQNQFDEKINPYYSLEKLLYFVTFQEALEHLLSKNNRTKEVYPNGDVVSYDYVYDGNLPKGVTIKDSSDPWWIFKGEFYY